MFPGFFISVIASLSLRFNFRSNQLVTLSVNIDNLDRIIFFQVLTQFRDIHVHTTCIEIVIVNPDCFQSEVTLQESHLHVRKAIRAIQILW